MMEYVAVGYIFSAKGLKGEVKIKPLTKRQRFIKDSVLKISPPVEKFDKLTVEKAYLVKNNFIVKFKEINNFEETEIIKNHYLEVEKTPLPEGMYYTDELIGLNVISADGNILGSVTEIHESKAHDILSVKGNANLEIPVISKYIKKIDIENKRIVVKETEGLFEL